MLLLSNTIDRLTPVGVSDQFTMTPVVWRSCALGRLRAQGMDYFTVSFDAIFRARTLKGPLVSYTASVLAMPDINSTGFVNISTWDQASCGL